MEELELYLEKAQAADESISSFTEVVGNVPTPWEKGDVITFPATIKGNAFKTKIGNKKYEYIVVHVKSADGSERQANFFPPLFRRRARVCEWKTVDGVDVTIPTNDFVVAGGSIVEQLYTKKRKVNDVVLAVLGKSIKISEVHEVKSQESGTNNPKLAKVYDFEPEGWTIGDAPVDIPEETTTDSDAVKEIYDINIKQETFLLGDIYMKDIPLIEDWGTDKDDKLKIEAQCEVESYDEHYEIKFVKPKERHNGQHNGHEWVDLGLPSGVKWAICNVGASSPEQHGNHYAWGETRTSAEYTSCHCLTYGLSLSQLESLDYIDSECNLTSSHDAATANWGGSWRMPTYDEMKELVNNCTWELTTYKNIYDVFKVTGPNGNSVFLPFSRYSVAECNYAGGHHGSYWSSSPYSIRNFKEAHFNGDQDLYLDLPRDYKDFDNACFLQFSEDIHFVFHDCRYIGRSVRPVLD